MSRSMKTPPQTAAQRAHQTFLQAALDVSEHRAAEPILTQPGGAWESELVMREAAQDRAYKKYVAAIERDSA